MQSFGQAGDRAYVHSTNTGNIISNASYLDHERLNGQSDYRFFVTHSLAGDGSVDYNNIPTGVYYSTGENKWMVYNENATGMQESMSYNIYLPGSYANVISVTAPGGNYYFIIDDPELNDKPDLHPVITHVWDSSNSYSNNNFGVYYATAVHKWGIYNEDASTEIPSGLIFNVLVEPSKTGYNTDMSFTYTVTTQEATNAGVIDHPLLNNNPEAIFVATHVYSGYLDQTLTTYYKPSLGKWLIVAEHPPQDMVGHIFNIVVSHPVPVNNDCSDAISLTVGDDFDENSVTGTLWAADGTFYAGVWYKVTVPSSGNLTVETKQASGSAMDDTFMVARSGSCGSLSLIDFDDDGGTGNFSKISLTGLTPGVNLYFEVQADVDSSAPNGEFLISAYDPTAGVTDAYVDGFTMYPNPVKDVLHIHTDKSIQNIEVYNLLGQKMLETQNTDIDVSSLTSGTYMLKVQTDDQSGSYKLIKK